MELSTSLSIKKDLILEWITSQYKGLSLPLYNSFDLRVSSHKLCPVDANFFPAAFNRLPLTSNQEAIRCFQEYFLKIKSDKILLIPENQLYNTYYLSNITRLKTLLEKAGKEVVIGTIKQPVEGKIEVLDHENIKLEMFSLRIRDGIIKVSNGFRPDIILMNHDMRKLPALIDKARQPIFPDINIGWWQRNKITFFNIYNQLIEQFCKDFNLNKLLFSIETEAHDFNDTFYEKVREFHRKLQELYRSSQIPYSPYVIIKPSQGTYGRSIVTISSESDIEKALSYYHNVIKDKKLRSTSLILQEGIKTTLINNQAAAEPVVYTIGNKIVAGFYRYNKNVDDIGNLNCKGAKFDNMTIMDEEIKFVAQMANLAASI